MGEGLITRFKQPKYGRIIFVHLGVSIVLAALIGILFGLMGGIGEFFLCAHWVYTYYIFEGVIDSYFVSLILRFLITILLCFVSIKRFKLGVTLEVLVTLLNFTPATLCLVESLYR